MSSAGVLQPVLAHDLFHLVFQMEFQFFQTMFFQFLLGGQRMFCFERLYLTLIFMVLSREFPVFIIRLHQVRFDFFECVLFHSWHLSLVESPRLAGRGTATGMAGSFTSLEVANGIDRPSNQDFTMNLFSSQRR